MTEQPGQQVLGQRLLVSPGGPGAQGGEACSDQTGQKGFLVDHKSIIIRYNLDTSTVYCII